jgi:hypothetical protein
MFHSSQVTIKDNLFVFVRLPDCSKMVISNLQYQIEKTSTYLPWQTVFQSQQLLYVRTRQNSCVNSRQLTHECPVSEGKETCLRIEGQV